MVNGEATIYGTELSDKGYLQLEVATCGSIDMTLHPTLSLPCVALRDKVAVAVEVTNFMEETGGLKSFTEKFAVIQGYAVSS